MLSPLTVSAKSACLSCRYEPLTISIASSFNLISAYTAEIKAVSKAIEETLKGLDILLGCFMQES